MVAKLEREESSKADAINKDKREGKQVGIDPEAEKREGKIKKKDDQTIAQKIKEHEAVTMEIKLEACADKVSLPKVR